jgi:hypothetical protein
MKIGEKVVCVDDNPCLVCSAPLGLIKNNVYVIRGLRMTTTKGSLILDLIGMNPNCHTDGQGYSAKRFRSLDELKKQSFINQENKQYK